MPRKQQFGGKQKTRKSAVKRFKITGSGRVFMRPHNIRHLMRNKSKRAKREGRIMKEITGKLAKKIKQMIQA